MSELKQRLDNLRALIQEPEFLEGKGLSNEVNIRIFCYNPSDEMMVRHFIEQIMTDQSMNCHLIEYNLYEVFLSICEDKRIAKTIPAMEEKKGKEKERKFFIISLLFMVKLNASQQRSNASTFRPSYFNLV